MSYQAALIKSSRTSPSTLGSDQLFRSGASNRTRQTIVRRAEGFMPTAYAMSTKVDRRLAGASRVVIATSRLTMPLRSENESMLTSILQRYHSVMVARRGFSLVGHYDRRWLDDAPGAARPAEAIASKGRQNIFRCGLQAGTSHHGGAIQKQGRDGKAPEKGSLAIGPMPRPGDLLPQPLLRHGHRERCIPPGHDQPETPKARLLVARVSGDVG